MRKKTLGNISEILEGLEEMTKDSANHKKISNSLKGIWEIVSNEYNDRIKRELRYQKKTIIEAASKLAETKEYADLEKMSVTNTLVVSNTDYSAYKSCITAMHHTLPDRKFRCSKMGGRVNWYVILRVA